MARAVTFARAEATIQIIS